VPPFYDYLQFGWKYAAASEYRDLYALGFKSENGIESFPLNQGGFIEFRHGRTINILLKTLLSSSADAGTTTHLLAIFLGATVGPAANGWLLGKYRAPDHFVSDSGPVDMRTVKEFYLLKGAPKPPDPGGAPVRVEWRVCGTLVAAGSSAKISV